jgi:hypothetical protein
LLRFAAEQAHGISEERGALMTTKAAKSKARDLQQNQNARPGSAAARETILAPGSSVPSEGQGTYWGDRIAFKVWLSCFLLMALMVLYDAITGLLRGFGSN